MEALFGNPDMNPDMSLRLSLTLVAFKEDSRTRIVERGWYTYDRYLDDVTAIPHEERYYCNMTLVDSKPDWDEPKVRACSALSRSG